MINPEYGVGDIAKELGKRWSDAGPELKGKYEAMAEKDKARYERVSISLSNSIISNFETKEHCRKEFGVLNDTVFFLVCLQEMTAYKKKIKDGPGVGVPAVVVAKKAESEEEWEDEDE